MGRPKKQDQLRNDIQRNLTNTLKTQEQARGLIEEVITKIQTHLSDENVTVTQQLEMMGKLAECVALLGRTNDSTMKTIKALDDAEKRIPDPLADSELYDLEPEELLATLAKRTKED